MKNLPAPLLNIFNKNIVDLTNLQVSTCADIIGPELQVCKRKAHSPKLT